MGYDEIAGNLSGRHTEETPGLPARAFFTAQRLGKPNMGRVEQSQSPKKTKRNNTNLPNLKTPSTTGGGFKTHCHIAFNFLAPKSGKYFKELLVDPI